MIIYSSFYNAGLFFSAFEREIPGLEEKDKRIRIWLAAQQPTLADRMEESIAMLAYLGNSIGPSPMAVLSTCYKQFGLILLKEKSKVSK